MRALPTQLTVGVAMNTVTSLTITQMVQLFDHKIGSLDLGEELGTLFAAYHSQNFLVRRGDNERRIGGRIVFAVALGAALIDRIAQNHLDSLSNIVLE
jgi:hypothetical protein